MTAAMNWDEAETLFHEFGHALHHLLTEVDDYSASGISGVEWDAVELPSQFMENFIWNYELLETMTAHVDSGAPLPRALFDKALAARRFQSGLWLMRQLEFAFFDLLLHTGKPLAQALKEAQAQTQILAIPITIVFTAVFPIYSPAAMQPAITVICGRKCWRRTLFNV